MRWVLKNRMRPLPRDEYEDAFQDGCLGLWKAEQTYDESKGVPFTSYAIRCIENAIFTPRRRPRLPTYDPTTVQGIDESLDPARIVELREQIAAGAAADRWGIIDLLRKGYTQQEIGEQLGVSQPVVCRRIKLIRRAIQNGQEETETT